MKYLQENKKVRYPHPMKKSCLLGEGKEGEVYHVKEEAIKFYKPVCTTKIRLDKETAIFLSKINTKRILTPNHILLNKRRVLQGYSTTYVENLGLESLLELEIEKLKEELTLLKEDLTLLSDYSILLGDLGLDNTSFYHGIYLFDPGSYQRLTDLDPNQIYGMNMDQMNEYLLSEILFQINYRQTNNLDDSRQFLKNIFHDYIVKEIFPDFIEYLKEDIKEENILMYIKKKKLEFKKDF